MIYYYSSIFLMYLFSILEIGKVKRKYFILFLYLFLVVQVSVRWETGTDWNSYLNHFEGLDSKNFFSISNGFFEIGYSLLVYISKFFFNSYSFFLLIYSLIFYNLIFKSFIKFSPYFFISILIFYSSNLGMLGSHRQLMALAIGFYSLKYLLNNKKSFFFIGVIIACFFHISAVMFFIYFFLNKQLSSRIIILNLLISSLLGYFLIGRLLSYNFSFFTENYALIKLLTYAGQDQLSQYSFPIIGFIKRILIFGLFFFYRKNFINKIPSFNLIFNGYLISIIIFTLFAFSFPIMISRGSLYFNIMEPILISYALYLIKGNQMKYLLATILFVLSFFLLNNSISPYRDLFDPFKGLFINTDYSRQMY